MNWQYLSKQTPKTKKQLLQVLLKNREVSDFKSFLNPPHPQKITLDSVEIDEEQMKLAVKRINKAVKEQEKVVIFGDYDADGITAASLLWLTFRELGLLAQPFIPDRKKHGYGISIPTLEEIKEKYQPDLVVTVDNGIVAQEAVSFAKQNEIDVIITDHHQPHQKQPPALAVIHSTKVCGAAVAWFLARELNEVYAQNLLDLVGIATITDQMILQDSNRAFAKHGIEALKKTDRVGLQALYQRAGVKPDEINSYTIGFVVGPRINAVGRLEHGLTAVRLLCTSSLKAAKTIAGQLDQTNLSRQQMTDQQLELALKQVEIQPETKLIFVHSPQFHEGIIGLIAGKLTEKFYKPAIAIDSSGEVNKGSARSVSGVSIIDLIRQCEGLLEDAGGHELAAGFSVKKQNLNKFKHKISELAQKEINPKKLEREFILDLKLDPSLLSLELARAINQLKPFGLGNYPPAFGLENATVLDAFTIGKNDKHLKLVVKFPDQARPLPVIAWNKGGLVKKLSKGQVVSLAASLDINHWNGKTNLQLKLKDLVFAN